MDRTLYKSLWETLAKNKAMVFMSGPRQSGKTTFAKRTAKGFSNALYFNWDLITDRKKMIKNPLFFEELNRADASVPLIIFDEIHKYRKWKNYLKGIYDHFSESYKFLVLGSGRLNVFQKGGDSLAGRYFQFNFFPFTLAELADRRIGFKDFCNDPLQFIVDEPRYEKTWEQLSLLSGFPEPFLSEDETVYRRWSETYHHQLIREDIRNMTEIKSIDLMEVMFSLLPSKIGSPLSFSSLARDLDVSPGTVQEWAKIFESFYLVFLIQPWTKKVSRAIKKEKKLYLFDYSMIPSAAARFENMVAVELLRAVSNWNDLGLGRFSLNYLRNKEKEETDFLIANNNEPFLLIEAKLSEDQISKSLIKFQSVFRVPAIQVINKPNVARLVSNGPQKILLTSATRWLPTLP